VGRIGIQFRDGRKSVSLRATPFSWQLRRLAAYAVAP